MNNAKNRRERITTCRLPKTRLLVVTLTLAALSGALWEQPAAAQEDEPKIEDTRNALHEWVEIRKKIAKEKQEWALGREMLQDRIEVLQQEVKAVRERIAEAEESIAKAEEKREKLQEQHREQKETAEIMGSRVETMEARVKMLLPRLPDPIRKRVKPLSQRLPKSSEDTRLSLSERFQNVIGILNEINKFNREVSWSSEVIDLPDGTSVQVTAVYFGIGQGYYVNANGDVAGRGTSTAEGWQWTPAPEAAGQIADVIDILNNEQVAAFITLPVEIK